MRRIAFASALAVMSLAAASCSIPFTVETDTESFQISIAPALLPGYQESLVEIPAQALQQGVQFSSVRFHYSVTTDSSLSVAAQIWVSDDQQTDDRYDAQTDDKIIDVTLTSADPQSGWSESPALVRALNARQQYIVVGGYAKSITGTGAVTIDVYAEITGSVAALQ